MNSYVLLDKDHGVHITTDNGNNTDDDDDDDGHDDGNKLEHLGYLWANFNLVFIVKNRGLCLGQNRDTYLISFMNRKIKNIIKFIYYKNILFKIFMLFNPVTKLFAPVIHRSVVK